LGFFVESINGNEVRGRIVPITGIIDSERRPGARRRVPACHPVGE
jgi:hypothetical protein